MKNLLLLCFMLVSVVSRSQESVKTLQKIKVSGYIQMQYQHGEKDASLSVGAENEGRDEDAKSFSRIGIRRGRIKFLYEDGMVQCVFQPDFTEKGVTVKDLYLKIKDPWVGSSTLTAGIFSHPFGYESAYSSMLRESPERAAFIRSLFPSERDLGAMLTLRTAENSILKIFKLEAGLFSGNGVKPQTDSKPDFIGRLSAEKNVWKNVKAGGGISYYNGAIFQTAENSSSGKYALRRYTGFDFRLAVTTDLGMSQLRSEYLTGQQPKKQIINNVNGGYVIFIQDIGTLPLAATVKYDWLDPDASISGNEINTEADAARNTLGFGILYGISKDIRLQTYYEINGYEKSNTFPELNKRKENVFTFRLQYRF